MFSDGSLESADRVQLARSHRGGLRRGDAMARTAAVSAVEAPVFFSTALDFLCLGGGSLIALPILGLMIPDSAASEVGMAVLILSFFVNHPHFAHSYQIFYGSYRRITRSTDTDPILRRRYVWSGLVLPVLLVGYFALAIGCDAPAMLRFAVNVMSFLAGWHYVKQGYGILMADAALKRNFFSERARNLLMINAYACWALSWLLINSVVADRNFLGLGYYAVAVSDSAIAVANVVAGISSLLCLAIFVSHARKHGPAFPVSGVAAYLASLYIWLFAGSQPELIALIPAFHSLQYLLIVWRCRMNVEAGKSDANAATLRFGLFVAAGMVLGFSGFYLVPTLLDGMMAYDPAQFGLHPFIVMFWVFINLHHFFIDNAMWRKENPHTMRALLACS